MTSVFTARVTNLSRGGWVRFITPHGNTFTERVPARVRPRGTLTVGETYELTRVDGTVTRCVQKRAAS